VNVNAIMGALGMGIVRLVRSTIGKTGLVQIAARPGMRAARNNQKKDTEATPVSFLIVLKNLLQQRFRFIYKAVNV